MQALTGELTDAEVADALSPADAVAAVREACAELRAGAFEAPPRLSLGGGSLLVMPVRHAPSGTCLTKVVHVGDGPDRVHGLVTWVAADGQVVSLCQAAALTELRTAAVTAVALDALAPAGAQHLVVLGTGRQARAHVRAVATVRELASVTLVGRDVTRARACAADLADHGAVPGDLGALSTADLVVCATRAASPLFDLRALAREVTVAAIGSHVAGVRELPRELLADATEVVVDDVAACLVEAGEVVDAVDAGVLTGRRLVPLADRVLHPAGSGRTVFKSVGSAAFDWAVAERLVRARG